ncbi:response regulator [Oceanispirochaeta crateris]|uniref:Response regulator n=1 Tax=Oceanispirochaeta crateris TaxID=2518645 RepID=A0A5C1QS22_9SPIO|nr:response regulator [Oceanispirochaeta crateris]QEN09434.1 response regulator [Oceanispirochaeta crateris]
MYKVLVVDDEEIIRKSIIKKLNKMQIDFIWIKDASNIDSAYMLISEELPDIIICDIRIGNRFGFELITKISDQKIDSEIIIISGYSDFSYAKKSLSLNVNDYLLKPIDSDDLKLAIHRSISKIHLKRSNREYSEIATIVSESRNNWKILMESKNENTINHASDQKSKKQNSLYQSLSIYAPLVEEQLFLITIANSIENSRYWNRQKNSFLMKISEHEYHILFLVDQIQLSVNQERILVLAETIHQQLSKISSEAPTIGLGRSNLTHYNSMKDSRFMMKHKILFPEKRVITYDDIVMLKNSGKLEIVDTQQLTHLIRQSDIRRIIEFLEKIKKDLNDGGFGYGVYESVFQKLFSILGDSIQDSQYVSVLQTDQKVYEFNNVESLFDHIKMIFSKVVLEENLDFGTDYRQKRVFLFKAYIDDNFTNPLSLQDYCNKQNLNISYLSKEFKNLIGVNYQCYLLGLRIEKAKEYLQETDEKIGDISLLIGFQDQHHFSRTFKKLTGKSPRDFRNDALKKKRSPIIKPLH